MPISQIYINLPITLKKLGKFAPKQATEMRHNAFFLKALGSVAYPFLRVYHILTIVSSLENKAVRIIPEDAKYLLSIKGVSPFYAAAFLAEIGSIANFLTPKKLIKYTGSISPVARHTGAWIETKLLELVQKMHMGRSPHGSVN
ncbi:hypothetical protein A2526_05565 [candidate division WOR-1 bacterium RIFOXYD2_FULL_36_8]|uniref:Transposase IS116/IS110/IS902 C-terminal domain-containing protein n=1 Tax=candidate division WOR-1 bacterium RIFOXYB2_FULL_36_35 TaxID=1802578 RepID=A0A1F4RYA9_UNCSA|nr:MAG: hypothetical protein A2230_04165 [candidate division WOR-1 bacterium RIFOXYA2_FULL_36_21]OGC13139.1 MAG: hypothetical protein A2290_07510 [candidate division WOR-1 bacterium RIFOXYB2_FULL_36_35]OGC40518.1 MAG: hypothetical protein A2526_05565 [candidate division WOR-1 bacterium RIFOXYD2_FULL_36_8]